MIWPTASGTRQFQVTALVLGASRSWFQRAEAHRQCPNEAQNFIDHATSIFDIAETVMHSCNIAKDERQGVLCS
jgi:hypothetical protein